MQINWNKIILVFVLIFSIGVLYASNHINNARLISDVDVVIKPNSSFFISADSIKKSINKYIYASKDSISLSDVEHEIDKNTFYDDLLLNISYNSDTLNLGKEKNPFRSSLRVKLPHKIIDTMELRQSFVGKIINDRVSYLSSKKNNSYIYTNTSSLGRYIISRDSLEPEIKPINFKNNSNPYQAVLNHPFY